MEALQGRDRRGGRQGARPATRSSGRTTPARASSKACRRTSRPRSASRRTQAVGRGERRATSTCRSAAGRRPAGSTTRRPTARAACVRAAAARVLDVFSYLGAWGLAARQAGAQRGRLRGFVGARARAARPNRRARTALEVRTLRDDAFDALAALQRAGEKFDVVVLDPPAFIKRKKDFPKGQAAYRKLNQLAMQLIARRHPGLLLVLVPPGAGRPGRRDPAGGAPPRPLRADPRGRRAVAGPPDPSGHSRNALPQGILLPRDAGVNRAAIAPSIGRAPAAGKIPPMFVYPIDPIALSIGRCRCTGTGSCTCVGFLGGLVARRVGGPRSRARPGSRWTSTTSSSSACSA